MENTMEVLSFSVLTKKLHLKVTSFVTLGTCCCTTRTGLGYQPTTCHINLYKILFPFRYHVLEIHRILVVSGKDCVSRIRWLSKTEIPCHRSLVLLCPQERGWWWKCLIWWGVGGGISVRHTNPETEPCRVQARCLLWKGLLQLGLFPPGHPNQSMSMSDSWFYYLPSSPILTWWVWQPETAHWPWSFLVD